MTEPYLSENWLGYINSWGEVNTPVGREMPKIMLKIFPEPWMSLGNGDRHEEPALGLVGGKSNHISMRGQVELEPPRERF